MVVSLVIATAKSTARLKMTAGRICDREIKIRWSAREREGEGEILVSEFMSSLVYLFVTVFLHAIYI